MNIEINQERVYRGYVSVCATIAEGTGIEALALQDKAFNRYEFIRFLYWIRFTNGTKPLVLFMDNLAVHKCLDSMNAYRNLDICPVFNIAYSPDYNPIESVFSQVKRIYKSKRLKRLANNEDFNEKEQIEDAFYRITPDKIDPCIRHSLTLLEDLTSLA